MPSEQTENPPCDDKIEWIDESGAVVAPAPLKDGQAKEAYLSYREQSEDWRSKFAAVFRDIAMYAAYSAGKDEALVVKPDDYLMLMLQTVSSMFEDLERGAIHPLAVPRKKAGRKPLNTLERERQLWMAVLAGACLKVASHKGESSESAYRMGARLVRKAGARIQWNNLRSAYLNRSRNGFGPVVETLVQKAPSSISALEMMAGIVAHNQNAPVF